MFVTHPCSQQVSAVLCYLPGHDQPDDVTLVHPFIQDLQLRGGKSDQLITSIIRASTEASSVHGLILEALVALSTRLEGKKVGARLIRVIGVIPMQDTAEG
jgi:hypothetical protein